MSKMAKGIGGKIAIKFTEKLIDDGSFYENPEAFIIYGEEYKWVDGPDNNGPLIIVVYEIDYIERYPDTDDTILIVLKSPYTFNNVEGEVYILYDMTKGNLKGAGGFVDSFSASFLPEDLIQKPNPMVREFFSISASATVKYITIDYESGYSEDTFKVTASANVNFIDVSEENP